MRVMGEGQAWLRRQHSGHRKPPYLITTSGCCCRLEPAEPGQPQRTGQDPEREQ